MILQNFPSHSANSPSHTPNYPSPSPNSSQIQLKIPSPTRIICPCQESQTNDTPVIKTVEQKKYQFTRKLLWKLCFVILTD